MWFFVRSLLISQLFCVSLPAAALNKHTIDEDLHANHAEMAEDVPAKDLALCSDPFLNQPFDAAVGLGSWASFLSPSHLFEGIRLHSMSAIQAFTGPEPSPSDFWEQVKEHQQTLLEYIPRMLESAEAYFKSTAFTDIARTMEDIVHTTATFRDSIQDALDAHHITLDMLSEELEAIFMKVVHELENIPPPSKASGHTERCEIVNKVLDYVEQALIKLVAPYEIATEIVTAYVGALRHPLCALIDTVGKITDQYPQLLPVLMFIVVVMLIPQAWILRPLLGIFGFGPVGPVKGSIAAWLQRYFWGAAVKSGSWFAWLQAAGMGRIPEWAWIFTKAPIIGSLLAMLFPS